jgi:hypothetical protein
MRKLAIAIGVAAMLVAIVLAARDNTVHQTTPAPVAIQSSTNNAQASNDSTARAVNSNPVLSSADTVKPRTLTRAVFLVREQGANGQLLAYNLSDGRKRFTLPPGLLSADANHYFSAATRYDVTLVFEYDPNTSAQKISAMVPGAWTLSGVSANGRWLALTRVVSESEQQRWLEAKRWQTDIQIVDATNGRAAHSLELDGNFDVDAISADGASLFLIQHLPAVNPDHYAIRLYDLVANQLQEDELREKGNDEVMVGEAWGQVASPDGHWLLTLYMNTQQHESFIHTLDLLNKYPVCVDLPSGNGEMKLLEQYALTLSPDGQTVYATNAALGVVSEVSLVPFGSKVVNTVQFTPVPVKIGEGAAPIARSVNSPDGKTVYFTIGNAVLAYDTIVRKVSAPFTVNSYVVGMNVSGDGKRLYVAGADETVQVFDAISGTAISFAPTK